MDATCVCSLLKMFLGPLSFISHWLELVVSTMLAIKEYKVVSILARVIATLNKIGVLLVRKKGKVNIR